jgi:hypothetical protein
MRWGGDVGKGVDQRVRGGEVGGDPKVTREKHAALLIYPRAHTRVSVFVCVCV